MENKPEFHMEELEKASANIDAILKGAPSSESPETDLNKSSQEPASHHFQDPKAALMEEPIIQKAAEPMVAMAAFIAEAVEGLQKAQIAHMEQIDEKFNAILNSNNAVLKAMDSNNSLIKSWGSSGANQFRSEIPNPQENLEKATPNGLKRFTPQFATSYIEKAVREGKMSVNDMATFEASGLVPAQYAEDIQKAWEAARG